MRRTMLVLALVLAGCGDDPVEPPTDEPFRLVASFASEPVFVETNGLGDAYGAMRLDFTAREETDTLAPINAAHLGEPIVEAWRYIIYDGDTLHAELDRGYYDSPDGGATIMIANVEWMEPTVEADGSAMRARASWLDYRNPSTFVDVDLRRR